MKKKTYGKIGLFDWKGDLSKTWYVYFSFRNPATGKLTRQNNIYGNINSYDTVRKRNKAAAVIIAGLEKLLETGWDPYRNNQPKVSDHEFQSVIQCISLSKEISKSIHAESTYMDYNSRMNLFKTWLIENGYENLHIKDLDTTIVTEYLKAVLLRTSARTRNNARGVLLSFYKILKREQIVKVNIIEEIEIIRTKAKKNRTFTIDQEEQLLDVFNQRDPIMGLFIAFISINLLRPVEVCRLKIADIDLKGKQLRFKAKNHPSKTKIIPSLLIDQINNMYPDLSIFNSGDYLLTPLGPGPWDATETSRRHSFGKRFLEIKKELGLGKEYGMYSFRATYITKLYRELRKSYPPFEAKTRLMHITGHGTMEALDAYLREIDAELPEDYSHLLIQSELDKQNSKNGK